MELPFKEKDLSAFFHSGMACIGEGKRRKCFRVPDFPYCVKFYRLPREYPPRMRLSIRLEIALFRFCPHFNTSCQEWRYYRKLRERLPKQLFSVFPDTVERVRLPDRGFGLCESFITNADGSPMHSVLEEMERSDDPLLKERLYRAISGLFDQLVLHAVRFYDPPNIMVQWLSGQEGEERRFNLRIVDFEPCERTLLSFLIHTPGMVRAKVRRRCDRYLAKLRFRFSVKGSL